MHNREHDSDSIADDLLVGCEAISRETGLGKHQIYYLAARGQLPGVRKLGARKLIASRKQLRALFAGERA
jgi:predicted DNA-binding transcriptional regulator AlpA